MGQAERFSLPPRAEVPLWPRGTSRPRTRACTNAPRACNPTHSIHWSAGQPSIRPIGSCVMEYSLAELALHSTADDAWICVNGTIYDITHHIQVPVPPAPRLCSLAPAISAAPPNARLTAVRRQPPHPARPTHLCPSAGVDQVAQKQCHAAGIHPSALGCVPPPAMDPSAACLTPCFDPNACMPVAPARATAKHAAPAGTDCSKEFHFIHGSGQIPSAYSLLPAYRIGSLRAPGASGDSCSRSSSAASLASSLSTSTRDQA
jgi:hypothetical protein